MSFIQIEDEILDLPIEDFLKYISELNVNINLISTRHTDLLFSLIQKNKLDLIKALVNFRGSGEGLNLNIISRNYIETTPLHMACAYGKFDIAKYLLDEGMDPNIKNSYGKSPICFSCKNPDIILLLLERGADINSKNKEGKSPLHHFCQYGNLENVKFLLDCGAKIEYKNGEPTCLDFKFYSRHEEKMKRLSDLFLNYRMGKIKGISRGD